MHDRVSFRFDHSSLIRQCLAPVQNCLPDRSDPRLEGACRIPLSISETNAEGIIGGGFSDEEFSKNGTAL